MENEIIIVEWSLDDILGELKRISLVSEPAIEADFMLFSAEDMKFKAVDEEKRVLTGPAMRPNMKIKRYNALGELYYGVFPEDVVRQAAEMFFRKGSNTNKTNLEHEFEIEGVYVFESWIVENPEVDKSKELGFKGVKKGDWFVSMKVDNEVVWNNYLKTGLIKGFSVEIRADEKEIDTIEMISAVLDLDKTDEWKFEAIKTLINDEDFIDVVAKPYVDETGKIKKELVAGIKDFMKISYDYDDTLSTERGFEMAQRSIERGDEVYIISARGDKEGMMERASELGIPEGRVWATGSNKAKIEKVKELGISKHIDNNSDVVNELGNLGEKFSRIEKFESYTDYPEGAKKNAQIALDWAEKNGWGSCGTAVGKARANQLAKGEPITEETIARMAAFERHRQNSDKELGDGCGRLMWQAWGGDEGIEWAQRKLEQIRKETE